MSKIKRFWEGGGETPKKKVFWKKFCKENPLQKKKIKSKMAVFPEKVSVPGLLSVISYDFDKT